MLQDKALAFLKSGKNVFLTGSAGTGKTFVLNQYITYLKERKVPVAVTASTGIAATHMNGLTIHSWAGIGVKEHLTKANLVSMKGKKYLSKHLDKVKVLIIDEISMLHKKQFELVNTVLQYFKNNQEAFGGIQVVVAGDFFQLPPVGNQGELSRDKFTFMSDAWVNANFAVCYLTEQFRQTTNSLNTILNEIRRGGVTQNSYQLLNKAIQFSNKNNIEPTKLYTHNVDVDRINLEFLNNLPGSEKVIKAKTKGNKKLIETLNNSVLASEKLQLKIGAKVMFVKNNAEKGYVNGSLGIVNGFNEKGFPKVKINNGKIITAEPENWTINDDSGKTLATFTQVPLRLAWAITIHKCQGMTLEAAEIDLSRTFEKGQGYVALSRLKNLDNLKLLGLNNTALQVDALAFKADARFKELSELIDVDFTLEELGAIAPIFISKCGGITDKKEIKKNRDKVKKGTTSKQTTYDRTLIYLREQKTLEEIADQRGVAVGTIAAHLIKIRKDNPKENLSFYRPEQELIDKVKKAYYSQNMSKQISLKAIYEDLNNEVSYQDIKLAIAFFD